MISYEDAAASFRQAYGTLPTVFVFAPGRINLIGEHIDYAGGRVLPVTLEWGVTAAAAPGRPGRIRVHSDQFLSLGVVEFDPTAPPPPAFTAFVHALALETGATGADIAAVSDLPLGRGWSSSAAFAVAVSAALLTAEPGRPRPTALELCQMCQRAETTALGVACGLMDQYAAVFGRYDSALLFDPLHLSHEYIPLGLHDSDLVVTDSGQPRRLAESGYNERRAELANAFEELRRLVGDFASFRDVEPERLLDAIQQLPLKLARRVRHVVTEDQRVLQFVKLLREGEVVEMGMLLTAAHDSLSDDYEVSTPELDALCRELDAQAGVYGTRLVGGGFGGSVLSLAHKNAVPAHIERALRSYNKKTHLVAAYDVVIPGSGAQVLLDVAGEPQPLAQWLAGNGRETA